MPDYVTKEVHDLEISHVVKSLEDIVKNNDDNHKAVIVEIQGTKRHIEKIYDRIAGQPEKIEHNDSRIKSIVKTVLFLFGITFSALGGIYWYLLKG